MATAQPIRHACSGGNPSGIRIAADSWTTVRVANVPICSVWNSLSPPRAARRRAAAAFVSARAPATFPARRAPAEHDALAHLQLHSLADRFHDAGSLVAEQHRQRMVEPGLEHVQIAMAHAGRLEPNHHLACSGLVELELRELESSELTD